MIPAKIHPELQYIIDALTPRPTLSLQTVQAFRNQKIVIDHKQYFPNALAATCHQIESNGGILEIYEFKPSQCPDTDAALLWLHGGGYVTGHGNDTWFGSLFAEQARVRVFSVHYRLAPEHPFPAARDDAWNALNWLALQSSALGINPERIAIGGGSAGAGLAAGLALYNRDQSGPSVAFQFLLYPMLDHKHDSASGQIDAPRWTLANSLAAWDMYLNGQAPEDSSVPATATNLEGLPPTFITVGEEDIFLDDIRIFASRLEKCGVKQTLRTYPGVFHAAEIQGYETGVGYRMTSDYVSALVEALNT